MSQQMGSKAIRLTQPGAGQTVNVPIDAENMRLSLGFTPDLSAVAKNDQNLEFTFEDGGKIVLDGYYDHFANKTLPVMITEGGDELSGMDFLAFLNEDLLTAAAPGAGADAAGGGSGEYADDSGTLIDGINRLSSLGTIHWDRAAEVPEVPEVQHQTKEFKDSQTITMIAVADAPTDIEIVHPIYADGTEAVGGNASVTFSVSAKFADTDGSEDHYILVQQQPGWTLGFLPSGYADAGTYTDSDTSKTYFKIQVIDSTEGQVNVVITLNTPPAGELHDGKVELTVGGMAVEKSNGDQGCNFGSEPVADNDRRG